MSTEPISPNSFERTTLECMLIVYLRSPQTLQLAANNLHPSMFSALGYERGYAVLFSILMAYYKQHQACPSIAVVWAELESRCKQFDSLLNDQLVECLRNLLQVAGQYPQEQIDLAVPWVKQKTIEFVQARLILPQIRAGLEGNLPVREVIDSAMTAIQRAKSMELAPPVYAFDTLTHDPMPSRLITGARWFDILVGGLRERGGEMIGFLGPSGQGKTMAGIDLAVNLAKRGRHVLYYTYEQPVEGDTAHEMTYRAIANVTGIPKAELERRGFANLTPDQQMLVKKLGSAVNQYIRFYDFSGARQGVGFGGMSEFEPYLQSLVSGGIQPALVVIDWWGQMLNRLCMNSPRQAGTAGLARLLTNQEISTAITLGSRYHVNFFIIHQSDTVAKGRPHYAEPKLTDAADAKNFPDLMQFCISMSSASDETGNARFKTVKGRTSGRNELCVHRNYELHRWEVQEGYRLNTKTREFEKYDGSETLSTAPEYPGYQPDGI